MATDRSPRTRVLVIEDDPLLRAQIVEVLAGAPDLEVAADYGAGLAAIISAPRADVALVDLGLPDVDGAELIRALREASPSLQIMVHTVHEDRSTVFEAIVAGASSYLLKGVAPETLVSSIRELRDGGAPMSPRIAREVIAAFQRQGSVADRYSLSPRELQILAELERGATYKEAAAALSVSVHTVHTHIKRIYEKLHASTRAEALTKARLRGML